MAVNWQSFRFANPTEAWQQQFNALAAQDPMLAFAWGLSPQSPYINQIKRAVDTQYMGGPVNPETGNSWANSIGNALINVFNEPGGAGASKTILGLPADWVPTSSPRDPSVGGIPYPGTGSGGTIYPPGGPPVVIDPSFPNVPAPGPGTGTPGGGGGPWTPPSGGPAGGANPYASIASLLPGYGLSQQLGSPQHGFGIPGFEDTPTQAGGSWAGTTFMPNQATTLRQNPLLPQTDSYAEYRARHGIGSTGTATGTPAGGGTPTGGATRLEIGQIDPGTNSKIVGYDGNGNYLVETTSGGDDPRTMVTTGSKYGDIRGDITSAGNTQANPRQNWLGVPITNEGWAINQAVPYQTSWYLSTYGGKPPPYINVHEQIGKSMEGVPPALPTFNWAGPNMMGAAQPYAVGMPPGGWTQMLGFTPGGGK